MGRKVKILVCCLKIYKIYCFPTAVLFHISETARAPQSHPVLAPSVSRARLNIHGAVCALCGWGEFQLVIYVPAAEHHCIPASAAQPAGLSMEEVGEVDSVSNPAQVLPKHQLRKTRSLGLCFLFAQPQQGVHCSHPNNLRSLLSVRGAGYEKASNSGVRALNNASCGGWDSRDGHSVVTQLWKGTFLQNFHLPHLFSLSYRYQQHCKEIPAAFPGAPVSQSGMFGAEGVRLGCSACRRWRTTAMCRQRCSPTDQENWFSRISLASLLGCLRWALCQRPSLSVHRVILLCAEFFWKWTSEQETKIIAKNNNDF